MENKMLESICEFVKMFGSSEPTYMSKGRTYKLEINLDTVEIGKSVTQYEGIVTRFMDFVYDPANGFKMKVSASKMFYMYSISNYDPDRMFHLLPKNKRLLPDGIGALCIKIPTPEYDKVIGRDSSGNPKIKFSDKEFKVNLYPKYLELSISDASDAIPD